MKFEAVRKEIPRGSRNIEVKFLYLGSAWGSGTFAGSDGSRRPSAIELEMASIQGQQFYELVSRVRF